MLEGKKHVLIFRNGPTKGWIGLEGTQLLFSYCVNQERNPVPAKMCAVERTLGMVYISLSGPDRRASVQNCLLDRSIKNKKAGEAASFSRHRIKYVTLHAMDPLCCCCWPPFWRSVPFTFLLAVAGAPRRNPVLPPCRPWWVRMEGSWHKHLVYPKCSVGSLSHPHCRFLMLGIPVPLETLPNVLLEYDQQKDGISKELEFKFSLIIFLK